MNAFEQADAVGRKGIELVKPILRQMADSGQFVVVNESPLFLHLQKVAGDFLVNVRNLGMATVELKTRERTRGDFVWEVFSNGCLDNARKHGERPATAGWGMTSPSQIKADLFLDSHDVYLYSMFRVKHWLWVEHGHRSFDLVRQTKYHQPNDTWFFIIPYTKLYNARIPVYHYNVDQGELFKDHYDSLWQILVDGSKPQ